jgi:lysophospholipase L1-like esterase
MRLHGDTAGLRNILLTEGDSISAGVGATSNDSGYSTQSAADLGICQFRLAVAGAALGTPSTTTGNNLFARLPDLLTKVRQGARDGKRMIVTVMVGVNAIPVIADYQNYIDQIRTAGGKVVLCTVTSSAAQSAAVKNAYNASLRLLNYDALADVAANPLLGGDTAYANTTYFPDGLHPSQVGHDLIRDIVKPAIESLMI